MIEFLRNICGDLKLIYLFPKTSQPGHEIRYTSGASHFLIREVGAAHISTRSGAVQIVLHVSDWSWNRDGFVEKPQIFLSGDLMLLVMWKNWSNKKNKENNLYRKNNISIYIYINQRNNDILKMRWSSCTATSDTLETPFFGMSTCRSGPPDQYRKAIRRRFETRQRPQQRLGRLQGSKVGRWRL